MMNFSAIKNRQRYLLWGAGSFLVGGMVVYGWVSMRETAFNKKQEFKSSLSRDAILTGSSRTNPQEAWVYQFRAEAEIAKKRLNAMEDMLLKILKINETQQVSRTQVSRTQASPTQVSQGSSQDPIDLIGDVREGLKAAQQDSQKEPQRDSQREKAMTATPSGSLLPPLPGSPASSLTPGAKGSPPFRSRAVRKISLPLRNARSNASLKTVDNTIPAGAFAQAVLLGGVDASASIQASSDPRPALLRITDLGTLPRQFRSDLKGCHALAACYGDISSERVFMRLEKLTCTERKTGEIVEVKVQGYVAGEDGRTGIRGSVVDRAGESMRNVLVGGFLGGIGEFLSQTRNAVTFSPVAGLAQANPMGMQDVLKAGVGKGASNALDKYAEFYIKRAEQLQPVIQVAAGRQVDIVFTEGISMGESLYRQALGRSNDQGRIAAVQQFRNQVPASAGMTGGVGNQDNSQNDTGFGFNP